MSLKIRVAIENEFRRFTKILVAITVAFSSVAFAAENLPVPSPASDPKPAVNAEGTAVYTTIIENKSPAEVARDLLEKNPDASVLVPESEEVRVVTELNQPKEEGAIQTQSANGLNTILIAFTFSYNSVVFALSPQYDWLQTSAMLGFNLLYLKQMELKLGRWSSLLQKGGRFVAVATNALVRSKNLKNERVEKVGNYLTHGLLCYLYYSIFQILTALPEIQNGFLNGDAQLNAVRKSGSGFVSGFGWAMTARKWDALPDSERPISRQAFSSFNSARSLVMGLFLPILIGTPNDASTFDFVLRNSPYFISAGIGSVFYFWGDPILKRYPQIVSGLERFERLTSRLNEKVTPPVDYIKRKYKATCAAALEILKHY